MTFPSFANRAQRKTRGRWRFQDASLAEAPAHGVGDGTSCVGHWLSRLTITGDAAMIRARPNALRRLPCRNAGLVSGRGLVAPLDAVDYWVLTDTGNWEARPPHHPLAPRGMPSSPSLGATWHALPHHPLVPRGR